MNTSATGRPHLDSLRRRCAAPLLLAAALACTTLTGCSLLGGGERTQATLYSLDPRISADPSWPTADWQLSMSQPTAARTIDTFRISVRPTPEEIQVYKGASWAKLPSDMLQDTIMRALEDSGRIRAVARQGSGAASDFKLVLDMRRFEADYAGKAVPSAIIEVNAKLLHNTDQSIVGSRTFLYAEPATGTEVAPVVDAFSHSLEHIGRDVAGWVLQTGNTFADTPPTSPSARPLR